MEKTDRSDHLLELLVERTLDLVRQEGRDLSLRQIAILLVCEASDDRQTVRGLAVHLAITKPAVIRAVNRLQAAGLARRKADPSDRRSVLIAPTPAGRRYALQFFGQMRRETRAVAAKARASATALPQHPCQALLSPAQVREARDLLEWSQSRLASMAEMTTKSITKFELGGLPLPPGDLQAMRAAIEAAGVMFVDENGHGPGVRLRKAD
jgi:DNA-binding MarR family transcriptional regulator